MTVNLTLAEMTPEEAAEVAEQFGNPDGWMIEHHRVGSTCSFGPFKTIKEAHDWWRTVGAPEGVRGGFIPLFLNVDWRR